METSQLYLQLHSLRREIAAGGEAIVRQVKSLGFDGVELAGDYGWTADKWRGLLDETGLKAVGAHTGLENLEANLSKVIEFHRAVGINRLIGGAPRELRTQSGYREAARRFNAQGARLASEGFQMGYHNHAYELEPLEDARACGMDILLSETDPALVHFEFDSFWLEHGGRNAADFIRQHAARTFLIHAKDLRKSDREDVPAGDGDVDFRSLIPLCTANGWPVILEYEGANAIEAVRKGAAYIRPLLG